MSGAHRVLSTPAVVFEALSSLPPGSKVWAREFLLVIITRLLLTGRLSACQSDWLFGGSFGSNYLHHVQPSFLPWEDPSD